MEKRECIQCNELFEPKPMGYNARYCTDKCKRRNQRARLKVSNPNQLTQSRARSYQKTKDTPEAYQRHLQRCRNGRAATGAWLAEYKLERGCVDCGYNKHSVALQLDHEGTKSVSIADARSSIRRLQAEIELGQCVVRCANCHAIKTQERKQVSTVLSSP